MRQSEGCTQFHAPVLRSCDVAQANLQPIKCGGCKRSHCFALLCQRDHVAAPIEEGGTDPVFQLGDVAGDSGLGDGKVPPPRG